MITRFAMETDQKYSSADITKLTDLLRASGDYTPAELAGMDKLTELLICLESMSDEDIEVAATRYFASV